MNNIKDRERFLELFNSIFEDEDISNIRFESEFKQLDEWDSLVALHLITMIDENYGVNINGEQIRESVTIEDIFKLIN